MGFEYHDEDIFFEVTPGAYLKIKSGSYVIQSNDDYIVASGQDPSDEMQKRMAQVLSVQSDQLSGSLSYRLGIKHSRDVDDWINNHVGEACTTLGAPFGDSLPQYGPQVGGCFAFCGKLSLSFSRGVLGETWENFQFEYFFLIYSISLATFSSANGWDIGGTCLNIGDSQVLFSNVGGEYGSVASFYFTRSGSNHIKIVRVEFPFPQSIK